MFITHAIVLRLIPGAGPTVAAAAIPLDVPGLEWTQRESRLHYTMRVGRMHWTLPDSGQFGMPEED